MIRSLKRMKNWIAGLAIMTAGSIAAPTFAQFGEAAGFGEVMSPYFFKRDLVHFQNGLELDEGQSVIVESLYWDYEEEHEVGKVRMLDRLSNMREDLKDMQREEILGLVFQPFEERAEEWATLRDGFLENVRAILNSEQLLLWDEFRRQLRREKELPGGDFSGESVNLYHVLKVMDLEEYPRSLIEDSLASYDIYMDRVLKKREELVQESRLAMIFSIRDNDQDASLRLYEEQIDTRVAVRNTNDDFTETIANRLPEDLGAEFRKTSLAYAYPRIYRPTAAQRLFDEALKLEGLSEEVTLALQELQLAFDAELEFVNERLWRLIREFEPADRRYRAISFAMRTNVEKRDAKRSEKPEDPTRPVFAEREKIGQRYVSLLQGLLTPEQFASLNGAARFLRRQNRTKGSALDSTGSPPGNGKSRKKKIDRLRPPSVGGTDGS